MRLPRSARGGLSHAAFRSSVPTRLAGGFASQVSAVLSPVQSSEPGMIEGNEAGQASVHGSSDRRRPPDSVHRRLWSAQGRATELEVGGHLIELLALAALPWMAGFGLATAQVAMRRERLAAVWFVFGAILGPIALLLLRVAPPGRCRTCGTPTRGWLMVCWWCREDVSAPPTARLAIVARMSGPVEPAEAPPEPEATRSKGPVRAFQRQSESSFRLPTPEPVAQPTPPSTSKAPFRPPSQPIPAQPAAASGPSEWIAHIWSTAHREPRRANKSLPDSATKVLGTAVYVTGSAHLGPGRRYGLALHESRLQILGPTDIDPSAIVLDRPVAEIAASAFDGRLIISEPRSRSGLELAFMSVAGATTDDLARRICDAAREAQA